MTAPDRWLRVRSLLEDLIDRPQDERHSYLAQACPDAPDIRADVESLLRGHDEAGSFLEPSAVPTTDTAPEGPDPTLLAPGTRLDHFEVQAPLGAGGMGQVYRALDTRLDRAVAIKVLSPAFAGQAPRRGWLQHEARSISRLTHPHICVLHDVGLATLDDGSQREFLVMELVEGDTLAAHLERGALPVEQAVAYGAQVADALAAAHSRGIAHGDLKPANIVLSPTGVKLLDFGLARLRPPSSSASPGSGVNGRSPLVLGIAGTLAYMAPEVLQGQVADERSDIHALGVVLYEMLSGRRPYAAASGPELAALIVHATPPVLPNRGTVPDALANIIARCLAKAPSHRWQHADELAAALRAVTTRTTRSGSKRGALFRAAAVIGAIGCAIALGVAGYNALESHSLDVARAGAGIRSLAVLPLENFSGDGEQEYFADGMTEALTLRLSTLKGVRVISRRSAIRFKDGRTPLREVARALSVDAVVVGSVQRVGRRVRITAQLILGPTDEMLWSGAFDRELDDVLALQSELAHVIALQIDRTIAGPEPAARAVPADVYERFLKARFEMDRLTPASVEASLVQFQAITAQEPAFASAHLGVAEAYTHLGSLTVGARPASDVRPRAVAAARRALALDPDLARAHALLGRLKEEEWHWEDAEAHYQRALALDPSLAEAHAGLGWLLICRGRTEEAIASSRLGRELDPLSPGPGVMLGVTLHSARRYDEAIGALRRVLALHPEDPGALAFLGRVLLDTNEPQESIQFLERAVALSNRNAYYTGMLAGAYGRVNRRGEAAALVAELQRLRRTNYVTPGAFVFAFAGLGDREAMLAAVEQAHTERANIVKWVRVGPVFDPLRDDPRFARIVERVGLR